MKRLSLSLISFILVAVSAVAADYIVIGSQTSVFDAPSTSQPLMNQFDEPVTVYSGMAFEVKGETNYYWCVDFPGFGDKYISKKSCIKSQPVDITSGTYTMEYDDASYPVTFKSTSAAGIYDVTISHPFYSDNKYTAKKITPEVLVISPSDESEITGVATCIAGKIRVWLYNNMILPWS